MGGTGETEGPPEVVENDRLCDYFLIAGADISDFRREDDEAPEPQPKIITKFPPDDYPDFSVPEAVSVFCFPEGFGVRKVQDCPQFYVFVLTDEEGRRTYGSCLSFCEKLPSLPPKARKVAENSAAKAHRRHDSFSLSNSLFVPKVICIISHWPFYSLYKNFLTHLYRISATTTRIPLERYVSHFLQEVPLPPPGKTQVAFRMGDMLLTCSRPPVNQLPLADIPMKHMFQCLDLNHILMLFTAVLTERKILLHSHHSWLLNVVCESILSLVFPFEWQHAYIPLLPASLIDFVHAPTPFLMGCHSSCINIDEIPEEVAVFDLDNNDVLPPDPPLPSLPEHQRSKLWKSLKTSADNFLPSHPELEMLDLAFVANPFTSRSLSVATVTSKRASLRITSNTTRIMDTGTNEAGGSSRRGSSLRPPSPRNRTASARAAPEETDDFDLPEVRDSFLRFFVSLLLKYQNFVNFEGNANGPDDFGANKWDDPMKSQMSYGFFDVGRFIQSEPSSSRSFLTDFLYTNMFEAFIEERVQPKRDSFHLLFFDECIQAKLNRSKLTRKKMDTPFLDAQDWFHTDTYMCPPADSSGLLEPSYKYNAFPEFRPERYKLLAERPPSLVAPVMKELRPFCKILEDMRKLSVQALSKKRHRREYYNLYLDTLEQGYPETPQARSRPRSVTSDGGHSAGAASTGGDAAGSLGRGHMDDSQIASRSRRSSAASPTGNSSDNESESRSQPHSPSSPRYVMERSTSFENSPAAGSDWDSPHGSLYGSSGRRYTRTTTNLAALNDMQVRARAARAQTVSGARRTHHKPGQGIPAIRELQQGNNPNPRPRDRRRYTLSAKYHGGSTEGMDPFVDKRKARARSVGARPLEAETTAVLGRCPFTGSTFTCECQCQCPEHVRGEQDRCEEVHCRAAGMIQTAWRRYIAPRHSAAKRIQGAYRHRTSDPAQWQSDLARRFERQESAPARLSATSDGEPRGRPASLPNEASLGGASMRGGGRANGGDDRAEVNGSPPPLPPKAWAPVEPSPEKSDGDEDRVDPKVPPPLPPRRGRGSTLSKPKPRPIIVPSSPAPTSETVNPGHDIPRTRKTVRACVKIQRAWRQHVESANIKMSPRLRTPGRRSALGYVRSKPGFGPNIPRHHPVSPWAVTSAFSPARYSPADSAWIRKHGSSIGAGSAPVVKHSKLFVPREYSDVDVAAARVIQHGVRRWIKRRVIADIRGRCASVIQSRYRTHRARTYFLKKRRAIMFIQAYYCMRVELRRVKQYRAAAVLVTAGRRFVNKLKARRTGSATLRLQTWWRQVTARTLYLTLRHMAVLVQSAWRGYVARRQFLKDIVGYRQEMEIKRDRAARLLQRVLRGFVVRRQFLTFRHAVITLQAHWRRQLACRQFMTSTLPEVVVQLWSLLLSLWDSQLVPLTERALFLCKFQRPDLRSMMALNRECNTLADNIGMYDAKGRQTSLSKERAMLESKMKVRVPSSRDTRGLADIWGHSCDGTLSSIRKILCDSLFTSPSLPECTRDAHLVQFLTDYTAESVQELMSDLSTAVTASDLPQVHAGLARWRVQAARCIQFHWRYYHTTRKQEKAQRTTSAATLVQAAWRMYQERRVYNHQRRVVIKLQAWLRGVRARKNLKATLLVATGLKGSLSRVRTRIHAARTVQRAWCHYRRSRAVTTLARWWRSMQHRHRFLVLRRGIGRLQAIARARVAQRQFQAQRKQVVECQRLARSFLSRKRFPGIDGGTQLIQAQALVRGYLARRRMQEVHVPNVLDSVIPAVAGLWSAGYTSLVYRSDFVRANSNSRLADLHAFNVELARLTEEQISRGKGDLKRAQGEYKKEVKQCKKALESMDQESLSQIYTDWEVDPKGKQRKNKLLDAISMARERPQVMQAAALIQALLPKSVDTPEKDRKGGKKG